MSDNEPPATTAADPVVTTETDPERASGLSDMLRSWMRGLKRFRIPDGSLRDTLDELIEEREDSEVPLDPDERLLLANILELRDLTIHDVMVPRADIVAVSANASLQEVIDVATQCGHSRLPIYSDTLDDAQGMVHIKDLLAWRHRDDEFKLDAVRRKVLFVAPSMHLLELLLEMRVTRTHMALVVDEYGGIDGLVTIEDLVEEIVSEIEDEYDRTTEPKIERRRDGSLIADARVEIETLEQMIGPIVSEEERENLDTLGGLVFSTAGRVPIRGEVIAHPAGIEFEILDADPRRIHRLRVRKRSEPATSAAGA